MQYSVSDKGRAVCSCKVGEKRGEKQREKRKESTHSFVQRQNDADALVGVGGGTRVWPKTPAVGCDEKDSRIRSACDI